MFKQILLFVLLIGAVSCGEVENNNDKIYGKWQATSWTTAGVETLDENSEVVFQFNDDDTYEASSGGTSQETGVYRLDGTKLYTTAEGQIEKMVEVQLPSVDTIIMNMNRSGTEETMIMVKSE